MGRRSVVALLAGFFLLASCLPAHADWIVAAFLGGATTLDTSIRILQPSALTDLRLDPIAYRGESFTSPIYYGYRLGWILPVARRLAIEAEFVHLKAFADTSVTVSARGLDRGQIVSRQQRLDETVERFSISHGVNFIFANVVLREPLVHGTSGDQLVFSARAGIGPTIPHAESAIQGRFQEQYELGSLGWQVAAGVEVRLVKGLHALAEYKFTRTNQTVSISGGQAGTLLHTHHLVAGAGYRF